LKERKKKEKEKERDRRESCTSIHTSATPVRENLFSTAEPANAETYLATKY
jgi:hypothetical protein